MEGYVFQILCVDLSQAEPKSRCRAHTLMKIHWEWIISGLYKPQTGTQWGATSDAPKSLSMKEETGKRDHIKSTSFSLRETSVRQ